MQINIRPRATNEPRVWQVNGPNGKVNYKSICSIEDAIFIEFIVPKIFKVGAESTKTPFHNTSIERLYGTEVVNQMFSSEVF